MAGACLTPSLFSRSKSRFAKRLLFEYTVAARVIGQKGMKDRLGKGGKYIDEDNRAKDPENTPRIPTESQKFLFRVFR